MLKLYLILKIIWSGVLILGSVWLGCFVAFSDKCLPTDWLYAGGDGLRYWWSFPMAFTLLFSAILGIVGGVDVFLTACRRYKEDVDNLTKIY